MPPRKRLEATVYIIDCSNNQDEHVELFYNIYSQKYFNQTKGAQQDIQTIILYNKPGLKSRTILNSWSNYGFQIVTELKNTLESADESTVSKPVNFLNILNYAVQRFDSDDITSHIKRIVFISNFTSNVSFENENIVDLNKSLHSKNIWLYVIGLKLKLPQIKTQSDISKLNKIVPEDDLTSSEQLNYEMLSRLNKNVAFLDKTHGVDIFCSHKIEPKPPFPWYVRLNIGTNLEIPALVYRTTKSHELIKFHACPSNPDKPVSNVKLWYDVNTHDRVQHTDVVRGYKFEQKFVEITNEQLSAAKKINTTKCLTIVGFVDQNEFPYHLYIMPDSLNCIKADPKQPHSAADRRFQLFVTSLKVKQVVAIAYRVYNNGNGRKLFCIFPCSEHTNDEHLLMGQIPYEHECQDNFVRGKIDTEYTSETFDLMRNFLEKLSPFDEEKKQELNPITPDMQVSKNRNRLTTYLLHKYVGNKIPEAPKVKMNPVIEDRALDDVKALINELTKL